MNVLIEKDTPLTNEEKSMFAYFGENAKIKPPFRILNPQNIYIGDYTSIREGAYLHAYKDLSDLMNYIDERYKADFNKEQYLYNSFLKIERETQISRFILISCTNSITIGRNAMFAERVYVGDNNHSFDHPHVPIMQQPNLSGQPVVIGDGSWIGCGAVILNGTELGNNCVVGANSVVQGKYLSHSVIANQKKARLIYRSNEREN